MHSIIPSVKRSDRRFCDYSPDMVSVHIRASDNSGSVEYCSMVYSVEKVSLTCISVGQLLHQGSPGIAPPLGLKHMTVNHTDKVTV